MIKIYLTNLGKYNEGELVGKWIELPISEGELEEVLKEIGIDGEQYEEYFITDYETDIEGLKIGEYENIEELNELAEAYDDLQTYEQEIVQAVIEWGFYGNTISDIQETMDNVDSFGLYEDINNDYDLGYYYVNEAGIYDLESMGNLANYIDYEAFGRDIQLEGDSFYSEKGYIEYRG